MARVADDRSAFRLLAVIALLVALIAGVVATSLTLSLILAAQHKLSWQELGNVGSFWNGHLGLLASLLLAFGVYLQGRQLRVLDDQQKNWECEMLRDQLRDVGASMRAVVLEEKINPQVIVGVTEIRSALRRLGASAREAEIVVDPAALAEYAVLARRMNLLWNALTAHVETREPDPILEHWDAVLATRDAEKQVLLTKGLQALDLDCLGTLVDGGWRMQTINTMGSWYAWATFVETTSGEELVIESDDGCINEATALAAVAAKWRRQYAILR